MSLTVSLALSIHDEHAFRQAAAERADSDGLDREESRAYLDAASKSLGDCAVMIFDPGTSPPGCSILDSSSEEWSSEDKS